MDQEQTAADLAIVEARWPGDTRLRSAVTALERWHSGQGSQQEFWAAYAQAKLLTIHGEHTAGDRPAAAGAAANPDGLDGAAGRAAYDADMAAHYRAYDAAIRVQTALRTAPRSGLWPNDPSSRVQRVG